MPAKSGPPHVTFLAICHNHAPYVLSCLNSMSAQTWPHADLVVLDNASTDGSAELIKQWAETCPRPVQLMLETESRGICANVNRALAVATGTYVAFLSADDLWFPHKTEHQVEQLEALGPPYGIAYADAIRIDAAGQVLDPASFISAHRSLSQLPEGDLLRELLRGPFLPAMSTLIRRQAIEEMGAFDEMLVYEDYDAWLRLAERWHFAATPNPLSYYRVLPHSLIHTSAAQDQPSKLLSDARIMAKAARNPKLEEKIVRNLHRRVLRLTTELVALPGDYSTALRALYDLSGLTSLRMLAARHRLFGPQSVLATQALLEEISGLPLPPANAEAEDDAAWQRWFTQLSPSTM